MMDATSTIPSNLTSAEVEGIIGQRLKNYVKGCTSRFTCGGSLALPSPPAVTIVGEDGGAGESIAIQVPSELRPGTTLQPHDYAKQPSYVVYDSGNRFEKSEKKRAELFDQQAADLSSLIKVIPPAAFGKGGETVYDASIRDALQLKAERYDLSIPQETIDDILQKIMIGMDLQTDIIAEPYSLNIYQKGGKFVKHKDTPRGDDMLGTLVICLPTWFTGGKMTVSLGGEAKTYFQPRGYYGDALREPPNPCKIEWCAFFADVDHEIHTVEEGIRLTATYLLRRKDHTSASSLIPHAIQGREQADLIMNCFLEGLRDSHFLPDGGNVGFPCLHLYTNTEVFPGNKDCSQALTAKQMAKLKGRDLMVANAATSAGLSVKLIPYLSHTYSAEDCEGDYALAKFPRKKRCPRYMSDDCIESFFDTNGRKGPESGADLWILDYDSAAKTKAGDTEWNCEGYFGNEASDICFYVKACLIIEVPSHNDSRGVPVQNVQQKKRKTEKKAMTNPSKQALTPRTQAKASSILQAVIQSANGGTVGTVALQKAMDAGYSKQFILHKGAEAGRMVSADDTKPSAKGRYDDVVVPAAVSED